MPEIPKAGEVAENAPGWGEGMGKRKGKERSLTWCAESSKVSRRINIFNESEDFGPGTASSPKASRRGVTEKSEDMKELLYSSLRVRELKVL